MNRSLIDHVRNVQQQFLEDLNNSLYPFRKLIDELPDVTPSASFINPHVFFNYHNYEYLKDQDARIDKSELNDTEDTVEMQSTFGININEFRNCSRVQLIFDPAVFDPALRKEVKAMFHSFLCDIVYDQHQPLRSIKRKMVIKGI
ncbi:hypothetical protein QFZ48_004993 [Chitinophaga sp. W2I13]